MLGHVVGAVSNVLLFGRITGLFATTSFAVDCDNQYQNLESGIINNTVCPFGIELNPLNYDRLHKLCHYDNKIISSTLAPLTPLFHENVMHLVYCFFGFSILTYVSASLEYFCWTVATKRQTSRMSALLLRSLIQRNMTYLDTNQITQYNTTLFTNIEKIKNGIGFEFLMPIAVSLHVIVSIIVSFIVNWQLSLIMSCIIPIICGSSLMFAKVVTRETKEQLRTYSKAGQIAQEVFSSLRTVLSFNGSQSQQKKYEKELKLNEWHTVRKDAAFGVFTGWLFFINFAVYSIGFTFGAILMSYGNHRTVTISEILVVVSMFAQGLSLFNQIGPFFQSISEAQGAAVSVFRLIDEAHDENLNEREILEENISDERSIPNINGDIEFDNVSFSYPSRENVTTLNNLKLIARANQTTALVGSSGCGKSTCVSLLLRYYEPSSGRIMIDGQSITDHKIKQFRQNIGVV
ncbi:unnamed protein product, partial [Adineta steineri]